MQVLKMKKKYQVIYETSLELLELLEKYVNEYLEEGWELVGGASVSSGEDWEVFTQTLIKYDVKE